MRARSWRALRRQREAISGHRCSVGRDCFGLLRRPRNDIRVDANAAPAGSRRLTALALWLAAIGAIGSAAADPIVVRDAFDRTVTLPAPPQRIVTIFASNTEIVAALGLADRIVGIDALTRYPPEVVGKPQVGGRLGFSVDAVAAQRPDLVIITPARQAVHQLLDPMARLDVPTLVLLQRSVAEIIANIRLLGRATAVPERGEALAAALEARLAGVAQQTRGRPPPRVLMVTGRVGNGLLLVARRGTYTGDAVMCAGGALALDAGALVPSLAQVSPEAILDADPDVLLYAGTAPELGELIRRPGWSAMRAVKAGRAYAVSRAEFLIPGPRTVDGIEHLADLLYPRE
jgi:iron complex transport system substrate-binding protein